MGKIVYSWVIRRDSKIPGTVVRSSTIPEQLGRISYLLTDKTGELLGALPGFKVDYLVAMLMLIAAKPYMVCKALFCVFTCSYLALTLTRQVSARVCLSPFYRGGSETQPSSLPCHNAQKQAGNSGSRALRPDLPPTPQILFHNDLRSGWLRASTGEWGDPGLSLILLFSNHGIRGNLLQRFGVAHQSEKNSFRKKWTQQSSGYVSIRILGWSL